MAVDVTAARYESGRRALQLAVDGGNNSAQEIASLLVQEAEDYRNSAGVDWCSTLEDIRCEHQTALEVAASAGHVDAVERLLAAGADLNAPLHEKGISALEAAAAQGQIIIVQMLLERGANPDHSGESSTSTPLIAAAMAGHVEICEALVQSGADVSSMVMFDHEVQFSAIEAAGKTSNITLLELFLGIVEETAEGFDLDEYVAAIAERRPRYSRWLTTDCFLRSAQEDIDQALQPAAATGNMLILQRLLDAGADSTCTDSNGNYRGSNPIAAAASGGQLEAMNKLLQFASDGEIRDRAVTRALQEALNARETRTALLEPLLQNGADATEIDIRKAAAEGHLDVLELILQSGAFADVTRFNNFFDADHNWFEYAQLQGLTALHLAAKHGHQAVVDLLLAKGAVLNKCAEQGYFTKGATALQMAVTGGHLTVTKLLVDAGADVDKYSESADTPLLAAIRTGNTVVLDLLLAAGADLDVVVGDEADVETSFRSRFDRSREKSALSVAAEVGNLNLVTRLLSMMSPECARRAVPWALQEAAENQHADIVRHLLQMRPDVNKRRGEFQELTFLEIAAANGNLEILEMLLSAGADVNLNPTEGWQPNALQFSSKRGDLAAVKLLLAAGAEVNVTGRRTGPPLLLAIRGGHIQVFQHLLAAGADIHATAYRGQTMLGAAEDSGSADILDRVRDALNLRSAPQIDQALDHWQGTGPLCETCRLVPFLELFRSQGHKFDLHPSLEVLRTSAAAGCPFCCFLWKRLRITTISLPQPSPLYLFQDQVRDTVCCHVSAPFPTDQTAAKRLQAEFLFFPTFFGSSTRVPITEDTSSPETYKQIRTWLDTCRNEHPRCRAPSGNPYLPTRLIYLDTSRSSSLSNPVDTSLQPRLVSTNGMEGSKCRYIALSYRWPEAFPVEAKSNRDNVREQMRGLNTSKLPQTFNDFFQVAIMMGINYVWIDSLCIVQDDPEDWNREAALMVRIYRYAYFTVAAAVPRKRPDLGLFRYPDPSNIASVTLFGLQDPEKNGIGQDVVVMKPQKEAYGDSPLISRGWCFQERETSRRIVHYTETQVLWECRTIQASEGLPYGDRELWPSRVLDTELDGKAVLKAWHLAVEDYSARHLTVFTDKFPALSGLAAAIRDYKPAYCRYFAGLWEDNFLSDLQWSSRSLDHLSITNRRYPEYVAPTWSWGSVAGPISYSAAPYQRHSTKHSERYPKHVLKVLDICVQNSANDPFGAVKQAVLTCTAGLVPCLLRGKQQTTPDYEVQTHGGMPIGAVIFDVDPETYDLANLEVVFCIHLGGPGLEARKGPGLVVLPTGYRENEYRRVGLISLMAEVPEFFNSEIKRITII